MTLKARQTMIATVALCVAAAGCGIPHKRTVEEAKSQLKGQEVAALDQCLGAPLSIEQAAAATEIWSYSSAQVQDAGGRRLALPDAADPAHDDACVFAFTVVDGRIVAVDSDNRAGWGFGSITECSALVEPCLGRSGS